MAKNIIEQYANTDALVLSFSAKMKELLIIGRDDGTYEKNLMLRELGKETALDDWIRKLELETAEHIVAKYPYDWLADKLMKEHTRYGRTNRELDKFWQVPHNITKPDLIKLLRSHMKKFLKRANVKRINPMRIRIEELV